MHDMLIYCKGERLRKQSGKMTGINIIGKLQRINFRSPFFRYVQFTAAISHLYIN